MEVLRPVSPPILSARLQDTRLRGLQDNQNLEAVRVKETSLSGLEAKAITVKGSVLEGVELSTCKLKKASLLDVEFDNCLLFGTDLDSSALTRVALKKGMYSGLILSAAIIQDVTFQGAKLNLVNFRVAKLERVHFIDCDLTEADFQGAELRSVVFQNCDLSKAEFASCKITKVDLRGSDVATVRGVAGLKGAKIDMGQLIALSQVMAAELGLEVEE